MRPIQAREHRTLTKARVSQIRLAAVRSLSRLLAVAGLALALLGGVLPTAGGAQTQTVAAAEKPLDLPPPIRTDSPRDTIETFLRITDKMETAILAYLRQPSYALVAEISLMSNQLNMLMDLDNVPAATRRETGIQTFEYLMDVFGRIGAPDPEAFPDVDMIDDSGLDNFRIPETPLRIVRMTEGDREGEFLFSDSVVTVAPRLYAAVRHLPLQSRLGIESWSSFGPQLAGPLIPGWVVQSIPSSMTKTWLDTPAWKVLLLMLALVATLTALWVLRRLLGWIKPAGRISELLLKTLPPIALIYATVSLLPFFSGQVNPSGRFATVFDTVLVVATFAASAALFWLLVRAFAEWIIRSPNIPEESLDANLLRLAAGTFGLIGVLVILAIGGQEVGLPVLSMIAGLGIGGLAVALAVRPTFENLIGGVILYVDRPVRVGDFCSVGNQMGTVEAIGIRSTRLRAVDRTMISIPNAQFADMQIVNWAQCDRMLINEKIGIRYDTTSDQLRYLLAQLRRMLHAHPRIDKDTVRVRFTGFGDSALNVDVRVYAETREWNDFFAIREDIFLRIFDLVHEAGTDLAFPSQTLYMARDGGRDLDRSESAENAVKRWRGAKQLPFPRLSRSEIERLDGTLDYPPYGSPDAGGDDETVEPGAEPLSAPPEAEDSPTGDNDEQERKV